MHKFNCANDYYVAAGTIPTRSSLHYIWLVHGIEVICIDELKIIHSRYLLGSLQVDAFYFSVVLLCVLPLP